MPHKGQITVNVKIIVDKSYSTKAVAWELFCKRVSIDTLTTEKAATIIAEHCYRYGQRGWQGSTDTEQTIGSDSADEYNTCYDKALEFITANFPKFNKK